MTMRDESIPAPKYLDLERDEKKKEIELRVGILQGFENWYESRHLSPIENALALRLKAMFLSQLEVLDGELERLESRI